MHFICVAIGSLTFVATFAWAQECLPTPTTTSGTAAIQGPLCSGQLIFEDNFDWYDLSKWAPEVDLVPGEFEWYDDSPTNAYSKNGRLFIRPSLTANEFGDDFLYGGTINLGDRCRGDGQCYQQASPGQILPPIRSARLDTQDKFSFKYGYMEVGAKLPRGDWLWPAIWLMPQYSPYGEWPTGGEIDIMESRGNLNLYVDDYNDLGVKRGECTLHFGPNRGQDGSMKVWNYQMNDGGFNNGLHTFALEWTENHIKIYYDQNLVNTIEPATNFWDLGNFTGDNPWSSGTKMAPFDQEFYLLLNLAVGGPGFFPDGFGNKPWTNGDPESATRFWEARDQWLPTWPLNDNDGDDAALQIDYVRIWAL